MIGARTAHSLAAHSVDSFAALDRAKTADSGQTHQRNSPRALPAMFECPRHNGICRHSADTPACHMQKGPYFRDRRPSTT